MDRSQAVAALVGGIAGLVLSLVLLGDDGPGIEVGHLAFIAAGTLAGVLVDRYARRRTR